MQGHKARTARIHTQSLCCSLLYMLRLWRVLLRGKCHLWQTLGNRDWVFVKRRPVRPNCGTQWLKCSLQKCLSWVLSPHFLSNIDKEPSEDHFDFLSSSLKPLSTLLHHGFWVSFSSHRSLSRELLGLFLLKSSLERITGLILRQGCLSSEWSGLDIICRTYLVICVKTWWKQTYFTRKGNLCTLTAADWAELITLAPVSPSKEEVPLGGIHLAQKFWWMSLGTGKPETLGTLGIGEAKVTNNASSESAAAQIVKTKVIPKLGTSWGPLDIMQTVELHPGSNRALSSPY